MKSIRIGIGGERENVPLADSEGASLDAARLSEPAKDQAQSRKRPRVHP